DGERYAHARAVFAYPLRLEVLEPCTGTDAIQDQGKFSRAVRGHDDGDGPPDGLRCSVPVEVFSAAVPREDDAIEARRGDGVVGGFHDRGHLKERLFGLFALGGVPGTGEDDGWLALAADDLPDPFH